MLCEHRAELAVGMGSRGLILMLLFALTSLFVPGIAWASTAASGETRIWAFDFAEQVHVGGSPATTQDPTTLDLRRECESTYDEFAPAPLVPRGTPRLLPEVSRTGQLTQAGLDHIVLRHWATSGAQNAGKFAQGTTARQLRSMIGDTLESGTIRANTAGRPGHIFEYDFGHQIGVDLAGNPATRLRVVRSPDGTIKTAFPF